MSAPLLERLRGGGARGREPGHAPDGEGEQEAPLEQDGTGRRTEREEEGVRSHVERPERLLGEGPEHPAAAAAGHPIHACHVMLGCREWWRGGEREEGTPALPACESAKFLNRKINVRDRRKSETNERKCPWAFLPEWWLVQLCVPLKCLTVTTQTSLPRFTWKCRGLPNLHNLLLADIVLYAGQEPLKYYVVLK